MKTYNYNEANKLFDNMTKTLAYLNAKRRLDTAMSDLVEDPSDETAIWWVEECQKKSKGLDIPSKKDLIFIENHKIEVDTIDGWTLYIH